MKKLIIIFCLSINILTIAQWQQVGQPLDSEITSLVKANNTLFASTLSKGVFATSDEVSWVARNNRLTDLKVRDLAESKGKLAAGTDKGGVYISTDNGALFFSPDNGITWSEKNILYKNINDLTKYNNNLFAACEPFMTNDAGFIYLSTNFGDSWTDISGNILSVSKNHIRKILIDGDYIYVGTSLGYVYKRKLLDVVTSVEDKEENIPTGFLLSQNYPNPFNPKTSISFTNPQSEFIILKVYDILGNEITALVNEYLSPGIYNYQFSIGDLRLSSGVYFSGWKI